MAFSITPNVGYDLVNTATAANLASGAQNSLGLLGSEVFGSDGKRYVLSKANGVIAASTATCTVAPATFLAIATGGAYTSPATAMVAGDQGWFGTASV